MDILIEDHTYVMAVFLTLENEREILITIQMIMMKKMKVWTMVKTKIIQKL